MRDIRHIIERSDAEAEALGSLVRRQEDTIAAQQQALDAGATADAARSQVEAALAAAARTNDTARVSLARYQTTRSSLVEQEARLRQRNAELEGRLVK